MTAPTYVQADHAQTAEHNLQEASGLIDGAYYVEAQAHATIAVAHAVLALVQELREGGRREPPTP
jgi:hypothetical protein